jgi:NAD(P)-dependent dehydrogenase (short-subunit alcohol dehydrogenase family)
MRYFATITQPAHQPWQPTHNGIAGAVHRHYGRVDGLVNNAGRSYAASVEEIDPRAF